MGKYCHLAEDGIIYVHLPEDVNASVAEEFITEHVNLKNSLSHAGSFIDATKVLKTPNAEARSIIINGLHKMRKLTSRDKAAILINNDRIFMNILGNSLLILSNMGYTRMFTDRDEAMKWVQSRNETI